jgi:hypothetical protein
MVVVYRLVTLGWHCHGRTLQLESNKIDTSQQAATMFRTNNAQRAVARILVGM